MRTTSCAAVLCLFVTAASMAQTKTDERNPLSAWTVYGRQFTTALSSSPIKQVPTPQTIAVLTPTNPIVVRRIEAFSMVGPRQSSVTQGLQLVSQAKPCPLPFFIVITNGTVTQAIPMSSTFLSKGSFETYTDSGELRLRFSPGNRISLAVLPPDIEPPAPSCGAYDVTINVQYENDVPRKAEKANATAAGDSR